MSISVKICGITTMEAAKCAVENGADYIGFIFFPPSPRNITPENAAKISAVIHGVAKIVAVVVDMADEEMDRLVNILKPDYLQLHGKETVQRVKEIKKRYSIGIIKAVSVRNYDDIAYGASFSGIADILLFDAKAPNSPLPGGNGISFDWKMLQGREFTAKWMLSGGINIDNVKEAVKISGADSVDISSGIESSPGIKDLGLIKEFMDIVNGIK